MKLKFISVVVILGSFAVPSLELPFDGLGIASISESEKASAEFKRNKRTLTTICVEIKPSSPYDEPYFMCKGTDNPKYSKDTNNDSYFSKPTYKPSKPSKHESSESDSYHSAVKKINEYNAPSKVEYHPHSSYNKPSSLHKSYEAPKEYLSPSKTSYSKGSSYNEHGNNQNDAYSNYEAPSKAPSYASTKPSYADHHESGDEYVKPHQTHKIIYEKPSSTAYSTASQIFNQEYPKNPTSSYDHRHQPMEYSKPNSYDGHNAAPGGYSKPNDSYEPKEYTKPSSHDYSSSYDSNPSYKGEGNSKPSYGLNDEHYFSAPPAAKVLYSRPVPNPSKHESYENPDNKFYVQHNEQSSAKPYIKPAHHDYGKSQYSLNDHQSPKYRMMPQGITQPWESQPQLPHYDSLSYRNFGGMEMENQNTDFPRTMNEDMQTYTGVDGPLRFHLSANNQETPTLQSPYQLPTYPSSVYQPHQGVSYSAVAPSYSQDTHYAVEGPSYPTYLPAAPVRHPSYVAPSIQPADPTYALNPSSQGLTIPCQPNYMYSFQPVIMQVPCYSLPTSYSASTYGQSLGISVNPLQSHGSARSEANTELSTKSSEDHSGSNESQESDKATEPAIDQGQTTSMKSESLKKSSDNAEEKNQQAFDKNLQDQTLQPVGKNVNEDKNTPTVTQASQKTPEGPTTKEAYNAMMKMAKIAAQLNKDDTKKNSPDISVAGAAEGQGNGKSSEASPQFTKTK